MARRYRVRVSPAALRDIEVARAYIAQDKPRATATWVKAIRREVRSLAFFPFRFESVPEAADLPFDYRQLFFGNYRIVFRVSADNVMVMRVYHAAQLLDATALDANGG